MKFFLIFLFLMLSISDIVPYQGLRVAMKSKTFGRDVIKTLNNLLKPLKLKQFPDINDTSGNGIFMQGINLTSIILVFVTLDDKSFDLTNLQFSNNHVILNGSISSIGMEILLKYETNLMNMHLFGGGAALIISAKNSSISITYDPIHNTLHSNLIGAYWNINVTTSENLYIFQDSIYEWIQYLINKIVLPEITQSIQIQFQEFNDNFLGIYGMVYNQYQTSIDIQMVNKLLNLTQIKDGGIVMAFDSNLTMPSHSLFKKLFKHRKSDFVMESDLEICYNSQLVPETVDLLGKAGFFDSSGTAQYVWDLESNGSVGDLSKIIPGLSLEYNRNIILDGQCQLEKDFTTNDISMRYNPNPPTRLLFPYNCNLTTHGNLVLETIGFYKVNYSLISVNNNVFLGHANEVSIHSIYTDPIIPKESLQELFLILQPMMKYFSNHDFFVPGFKLDPFRRSEMRFLKESNIIYEMCYEYSELT